ncbi:peptide-methionine (S)-S-oxide reductase MsrA [Methylobacillus glycogenes]|uniref:peptide-methionine (S)-S-oxide reductase MsrA n=1 Tax=Methylobacillus glycogenes TaxID=406 RepID=UPI00047064DD|nr:peptide-methionine (S)-S-oxide reductase MsrA [Methylobacillus glycogenes]
MSNEIAVLAGGCFWCLEPVFSQLKGVNAVVSGYIGGHVDQPNYKQVCTGETGHAEAIQISFDPQQISYAALLEIFFLSHDPTTPNRQGNDVGTQYRSAVFYQDEAQKDTVNALLDNYRRENTFGAAPVTQVLAAVEFFPAEDYHQQYFAKNPGQPYCLAVAAPKVAKIQAKYAALIKP